MTSLFVADLHLDAARPATLDRALALFGDAGQFDSLWILGDLFEAWIGDDAATDDPTAAAVSSRLAALGKRGTTVHLLHGNRDFLLGESFAQRCGAFLHREDEIMLDLDGISALLLHGDTLCTRDVDYQSLRSMLRDPHWQATFLAQEIPARLEAARSLRAASSDAGAGKVADIMDVTPAAVTARLAHTGVAVMIHGHTHRPATHRLDVNGSPRVRQVLGDWHQDGADVVVADARGVRRVHYGDAASLVDAPLPSRG